SLGSHTITASYNGSSSFTTSSGNAAETVTQDSSSTAVTASPSSSTLGQTVTFTATVTAAAPGSGTPTGTVIFQVGSTLLATVPLSSGSASFSPSTLSLGNHPITASYGGDSNFTASSGSTTESVGHYTTTTALSAAPTSAVFGQSITFT